MTRMVSTPKYVRVTGIIERTTDKAIYFISQNPDGRSVKAWLPKSQIWDFAVADVKVVYDIEIALNIADWIADSKGLHYEKAE